MSLKYRQHLLDIMKKCTAIVSTNYLTIESAHGYELEITSYDTLSKIDFCACSNVYCVVTDYCKSYYDFYLDLYKDKFALCQFDGIDGWYIEVDDFIPFYPLTEESFFQMQLVFDLKDLTFDECRAIMHLCVQIPTYEDFS